MGEIRTFRDLEAWKVGMDLVEVNPILDQRNATAELAVEFALSALGKRIF